MMKLSFQLYLIILLFFVINNEIKAVEIQPRKSPSCAFLSNKIYCFGGNVEGSSADSDFYFLDIYKNNNEPVQNLSSQWEIITPKNPSNIDIGRRDTPQAALLPDGDSYLIQGGYNYMKYVDPQQTIIYNAKTNTLTAGANYNDVSNGGDRQIYYGTAVYIPHLNSVGFYGGFQQHVTPGSDFVSPEGTSTSGLTFNNTDGYVASYAGFYYLTLYNINSNAFSVPVQYNNPKRYYSSQNVFLHTKTNKLFYIGGRYYNTTSGSFYTSFLTYTKTYNTVTSQWLEENIGGSAPTTRRYHTTTLLDNGDDALLYGGVHDGVVMDYCYTLNIPLMMWTYHNIVAPVGSTGPRAYHTAVMVNKSSLFIMFGVNRNNIPTNDLLVLDVRNINNITFATQFPFDNISTNNSGNELGAGVIAGIVVGCIIAGSIIVLAFVFFYRRKRRSDLMEVDWDKIDDQFREINFSPQQQVNQENIDIEKRRYMNDNHSSFPIDPNENDLISSPSDENPTVVDTDAARPGAISPDIPATSILKPDILQHNQSPGISLNAITPDISQFGQPREIPLDYRKPDIASAADLPEHTSIMTTNPVKPDIVDL